MTGLHMAARYNDLHMLKICLQYGADLYACDHQGRKPIHQAANTGSMDTLKVINLNISKLLSWISCGTVVDLRVRK